MRLGVFNHGWWKGACEALAHDAVELPVAGSPSGNAYQADLEARMACGAGVATTLGEQPVDLLVDNGGTGLGFVRGAAGGDNLQLAHDSAGKVLCSHFIDPLVTAFQGLAWPVVWQCLQSQTWVKAVWDRAQVAELQAFGVPNVLHLPMAAPDRTYNTEPLDPTRARWAVSFVGAQNTSYFAPDTTVPTAKLLAGTLGHAIQADLPEVSFHQMYHDVYGLGEAVTEHDNLETRTAKSLEYYSAKLFYNAGLCLRNRDRFVIFLQRKLGDAFRLIGNGWEHRYGLKTAPRLATADEYFDHFRECAININLVNGNAETGLNMRHFEITSAGGFLLCHHQPELAEHFEIGKECAVFGNEEELLEKVHYYLSHPDERVAIARAGQKRSLSQHLYSHRLRTLLETVRPAPPPVSFASTEWWEDARALLPEADVILDCGANVGQTAGCLRNIYPRAEIHSFEPVSSLFETLRVKCETINVHPVQKAVADHDGRASINLTASPEANSLLGFQEGNPCAQWTRVIGQEEVEVCTLDRWCRENQLDPSRVDLIKLDVQGGELKALHGARKLLETVKLIYLEVSFVPIYKDGPLFGEVEGFLTECGYRRCAIYPSDQPHNWGDALYAKENGRHG